MWNTNQKVCLEVFLASYGGKVLEIVNVCRSLPNVNLRQGKHLDLALVLQVATSSIVEHTQDGRTKTILVRLVFSVCSGSACCVYTLYITRSSLF